MAFSPTYPDNFKDGTEAPKARPDENTVPEHCISGPDFKPGTVLPTIKPTLVESDEGAFDEVQSINTSKYGSDYEPGRRRF